MGLITRFYGPNAKGSKLTIKEMDNNLYYLQNNGVVGVDFLSGNLILTNPTGATLTTKIDRYNKNYIPSGETFTVPNGYQNFVYGDVIIEGTLNIEENGELVVLNGNIIISGGTIVGSGTTYSVTLPEFNTFVTSGNYNPTSKQITFNGNFGFTPFNVDLTPLNFTGNTSGECISDIYVTNVNSCSPLHIQPTNNGDVYISESGGNVGIGTTNPQTTLDINGDVNVSNSISATTFYGDGSNLSGITGGNPYTYEIGEYVPSQGGVIFHRYIESGVENYLVIPIVDQSTNQVWSNVDNVLIGPSAQSTWDGLSNSNAIIGQVGHTDSAAQLCLNLITGEQKDWYLPSIDELSLVWQNSFNLNKTLSTIGGATVLLTRNKYWSSTESNNNTAWIGGAGSFGNANKNSTTYYVRAVRDFTL
jgi:uncharacterized Zn-binding protein involved in type VI secretion